MTIRLTPEAEADVREARAWYGPRGAGLADDFLQSLDVVLREIESHPSAFPEVHREVRRALLRRFPYCVFYVVEASGPVVVGCLHARRSPTAWRRRAGA